MKPEALMSDASHLWHPGLSRGTPTPLPPVGRGRQLTTPTGTTTTGPGPSLSTVENVTAPGGC